MSIFSINTLIPQNKTMVFAHWAAGVTHTELKACIASTAFAIVEIITLTFNFFSFDLLRMFSLLLKFYLLELYLIYFITAMILLYFLQ